jgi:hypothetical protein
MEMARVARRMMATARLGLGFALVIAGLGLAAGGCSKAVCPGGMRLDGKRSQPGINAFCESTTDKTRAAYIQLYQNGGRRQVCPFVNGHATGAYQAFHPGGSRWLEGRYENGQKVGRWTQWAPDGRKVADGQYRQGSTIEGAPVGFPATCETISW